MNRQPKKGDLLQWLGADDVVLVLTDAVPHKQVNTVFWYYHLRLGKSMDHSMLASRQLKDWILLSPGEE